MREVALELAEIIHEELREKGELPFLELENILNRKNIYGLKRVQRICHEELKNKGVITLRDEKGYTVLKMY